MFPDKQTETRARTEFARVCVEINTECIYPDSVPVVIDGNKRLEISVEYKWKPPKCASCNIFGHSQFKCPKNEEAYHKTEVKIWQQKRRARKEKRRQNLDKLTTGFVQTGTSKETNQREKDKEEENDERRWEIPSRKHTFRPRRVIQREEGETSTRGELLMNEEGGTDPPGII
ncbi:hypothetical protein ACHQM5_020561 [Ranunculus cassubicifolius]